MSSNTRLTAGGDKQLNFTPEEGLQILKAVELLSNAGVIVWKEVHPAELAKTIAAPLGAELDLRIFITGEGPITEDNVGKWELCVYSEHGDDCAEFEIPDDVNILGEGAICETLERPSPRVLKNAWMAAKARELFPEVMKKYDASKAAK
jgi:hypothetical protein